MAFKKRFVIIKYFFTMLNIFYGDRVRTSEKNRFCRRVSRVMLLENRQMIGITQFNIDFIHKLLAKPHYE